MDASNTWDVTDVQIACRDFMEHPLARVPGVSYGCSTPCKVLESLNRLRLNSDLCDVILCCEGQEFPCHRNVLASFCSYFEVNTIHTFIVLLLLRELYLFSTLPTVVMYCSTAWFNSLLKAYRCVQKYWHPCTQTTQMSVK